MLKKKFLAIIAGISSILLGSLAIAQVTIPQVTSMGTTDLIQVIPAGNPTAGNVYANLTRFSAWVLTGNSAHSGVPVLTACGGGTPVVAGTDYAFRVTQGTTATGCVATFSTAFASTPTCVAVNQTAPGTSTPAYTVSTTAVTLVTASTSGEIWNVICSSNGG